MGPEYLVVLITAAVSAITGGSWVANKAMERTGDRIQQIFSMLHSQDNRLKDLEIKYVRMPIEYVLKVDFLRELQDMRDSFDQINNKLDTLIQTFIKAKIKDE